MRTSFSDPLAARPMGVRMASTMTASGMALECYGGSAAGPSHRLRRRAAHRRASASRGSPGQALRKPAANASPAPVVSTTSSTGRPRVETVRAPSLQRAPPRAELDDDLLDARQARRRATASSSAFGSSRSTGRARSRNAGSARSERRRGGIDADRHPGLAGPRHRLQRGAARAGAQQRVAGDVQDVARRRTGRRGGRPSRARRWRPGRAASSARRRARRARCRCRSAALGVARDAQVDALQAAQREVGRAVVAGAADQRDRDAGVGEPGRRVRARAARAQRDPRRRVARVARAARRGPRRRRS